MISFLSEEIRTVFHSLPIEKQQEWQEIGTSFYAKGFNLKILYIEEVMPGCLEAAIRIDKEFEVSLPSSGD